MTKAEILRRYDITIEDIEFCSDLTDKEIKNILSEKDRRMDWDE